MVWSQKDIPLQFVVILIVVNDMLPYLMLCISSNKKSAFYDFIIIVIQYFESILNYN